MQGIRRRVVYVALFEAIAIAISSTALTFAADRPVGPATTTAIASSAVAMGWNWAWNALFERWEARQLTKGRSFRRRAAHAVGFEFGLVLLLVPLFALVLQVSMRQALAYNVGLVIFFLAYGFLFNLAFDRMFGLPASAMAR